MFGRNARTIDGIEYAPGRKFRVVAPGMHLTGWTPVRGGAQGWKHDLAVGDVIECTGYGPGMGSDPGYGIEWRNEASEAARAFHVDLWPMTGSVFNYYPVAGSVEPVED